MKVRKVRPRTFRNQPLVEGETVDLWSTLHIVEKETGVKPVIYLSTEYKPDQKYWIQVSNNISRIDEDNNFAIMLLDLSIVGRCTLPQKHLIRVMRWIELNRSAIQYMWDDGTDLHYFFRSMRKYEDK